MAVKRLFDLIISTTSLLVLAPVMFLISVLTAIFIGSPVVFRQKRPGKNGQMFYVYKFRSMSNRKDKTGKLLPDCQRETRFGTFLRNTSLDELPQFINVFLGEMSLIGPRPLLEEFVKNCNADQLRRYNVRPGVTGWAQIQGRKALDYEKRFAYDVWYVDNWSLALDIKILFKTIKILIRPEGLRETGKMIDTGVIHPLMQSNKTDDKSEYFPENDMNNNQDASKKHKLFS